MTHKILIVEDDPISQMMMKRFIERFGYGEPDSALSDQEAIELVSENDYAAMIMDIRLGPGQMDGPELYRKLREVKDIPVIYVSASRDSEYYSRAMDTKPFAFVDKPISAAELRDKLALLFDKDKAREAFQRLDSAEILNLIYDTAKIGMCVTDEQGHFVKVNRAYVETYGYDEDELVGQPFTKVLPEDMREYAARVHDDFVHGRSNESSGEWKVKTKSGAVKDVYVTAGRFVTQDGKAFKVTTVEDITDRKRLVDQLQKSLSEKEVLMREIHHRVKNNMNMVSGLLYLQAEALKSAEDAREALFQSINRIKTLALVHEHLYKTEDYSRVSIKEYLESLVADLAGTFESNGNGDGLELTWDVEVENLTMDLDLCITNGLILNELVANAIKHGSEQDTLHISVRLVREGEDVVLTVADNGPGFPDDFSLEDADSLGMQLIYNLMRKLGGSIQIDSTHGAMVSIRYPLLT